MSDEPIRLAPRQIVDIGGGRYRVVMRETAPGYELRYLGPLNEPGTPPSGSG